MKNRNSMGQNQLDKPERTWFIIAGASKTGSEWIRACLDEHPDVFIPIGPTLDYFSHNYDKGEEWYRSHFDGLSEEKAVGEKSTSYIVSEEAPKRIAASIPDVELIFILRDPVDRAYSHYCMDYRAGVRSGDIEEELRPESSLVREGLYYHHLSRFREYFPDNNIHVLLYDDLRGDAAAFLEDVCRILGVDPSFRPSLLHERYHVSRGYPVFPRVYRGMVRAVRAIRRSSSLINRGVEKLRRTVIPDLCHYLLGSHRSLPEMPAKLRERLRDYYAEDVLRLEDLLDRDLSEWSPCPGATDQSGGVA